MIHCISGLPGYGKTSLMTSFAVSHLGAQRFKDIFAVKPLIESLNNSGWNLSVPEHLVFSNYNVESKIFRQESYITDGYYLGFANKKHPTQFLPPGARVFIDEAQEVYNSRESADFPDFASRFYEKHRHYDLEIYLACQRAKLIDLNVRGICDHFIEVTGLKHDYSKYGFIIGSTWECIEFNNCFDHERYIETGNTRGATRTKYHYDGNIFDCYDSKGCFNMFLKDRYDKDFKLVKHRHYGIDVASVMAYNKVHNFERPKTFGNKVSKK